MLKFLACVLLLGTLVCDGAFVKAKWEENRTNRKKPEFCGKLRCPRFRTVLKTEKFSVRCYAPMTIVTTMAGGAKPKAEDYAAAYGRIFSYINGNNKKKMKIKTVPFMQNTKFEKESMSWSSNISVYSNMRRAPRPNDESLFVERKGAFCVYVKSFVADVKKSPDLVKKSVMELYVDLKYYNRKVLDNGRSIFASYMQVGENYNEAWILAPRKQKPIPKKKNPKFCKSYDCPKFNKIYKTKNFSLRCYEPMNMVKTNVGVFNATAADYRTAFWRLFKYINGNNAKKIKIKMTVPVVYDTMYYAKNYSYTTQMYFYLSMKDAPAPNDPLVSLVGITQFCAYVKPFRGDTQKSPQLAGKKVKELYTELIVQKQIIMDPGRSFVASYSRPNKKGYNEAWVMAPSTPAYTEVFKRGSISKRCYAGTGVSGFSDRYAKIALKEPSPTGKDFPAYFQKLEKYMMGSNVEERMVDRGAPFVIETNYDLKNPKNFTSILYYYIPRNAPAPIDKNITVVESPSFCAYVKSFVGDVGKNPGLVEEANKSLYAWLVKRKQAFLPGKVFYADFINSNHHEAWFVSF